MHVFFKMPGTLTGKFQKKQQGYCDSYILGKFQHSQTDN